MNEPSRRVVYVGTFPTADAIFIDGVDPARHLLDEASAALDRARADEEQARRAAIADIERAKNTRKARAMRRLKRALTLIGYRRPR